MCQLIEGRTYRLEKVIEIEGFTGFIVGEEDLSEDKEPVMIDLGMKRILEVFRENVYLVLAGKDEVRIRKLECRDIKLSEFLKSEGIRYKFKADYRKFKGAWEKALDVSNGLFGTNGYAVCMSFWCDWMFHNFELKLVNPGWLTIEGYDIEAVMGWNLGNDVLSEAHGLITDILTAPQRFTGKEYADRLKESGLTETIPYLRMIEREEE